MRQLTERQRRVALEADDFLQAIYRGDVDIRPSEPEIAPAASGMYDAELAKQQAIAEALNVGRDDADRMRNYELLRLGIDKPYETRTGAEMQGLGYRGIDGDFKSDSTVRVHRNNLKVDDPLLLSSVGNKSLIDGYQGDATEYLSPAGEAALYKLWKAEQEADEFKANQNTPEAFNRSLQEYYGQQALKLAGNTPVSPDQRSYNVRMDAGRNPNSTLDTDRLIETNASILGGDVGRPAGDYRYVTPDGRIKVGDYQVADYRDPRRPMDAFIRLQMIKGSKMSPEQQTRFAGNIREAAVGVEDIDKALQVMQERGDLPELVMGNIKQDKPRYFKDGTEDKRLGMRAGKMMSDAPFMGQLNRNRQHRYEHVLYGLQGPELKQLGAGGGIPRAYFDVPTKKARQYMANNTDNIIMGEDGSAFMRPTLAQLLNAGVATDLVSAYPQVRQLL